jgi:hypothetical protein
LMGIFVLNQVISYSMFFLSILLFYIVFLSYRSTRWFKYDRDKL